MSGRTPRDSRCTDPDVPEETMDANEETQAERPRAIDPLTGLLHREAWERHAPAFLEDAHIARVPVCVLLLDLDDFGAINARHGQEEGDRVLRELAARWRSHVRHNDLIARVGPDDFAVLLIACSLEAASAVARRLSGLVDIDGVTVSIGGSEWNGSETAIGLLARAEAALHRAQGQQGERIAITAELSATRS
jgi:diguanylate cyclase (GGDEF)-like protein